MTYISGWSNIRNKLNEHGVIKVRNDNLPDDCQGNGAHLPWNEPEQEVFCCWDCGDEVENEDELTEVKTKRNGLQFIGECCIEDYIE